MTDLELRWDGDISVSDENGVTKFTAEDVKARFNYLLSTYKVDKSDPEPLISAALDRFDFVFNEIYLATTVPRKMVVAAADIAMISVLFEKGYTPFRDIDKVVLIPAMKVNSVSSLGAFSLINNFRVKLSILRTLVALSQCVSNPDQILHMIPLVNNTSPVEEEIYDFLNDHCSRVAWHLPKINTILGVLPITKVLKSLPGRVKSEDGLAEAIIDSGITESLLPNRCTARDIYLLMSEESRTDIWCAWHALPVDTYASWRSAIREGLDTLRFTEFTESSSMAYHDKSVCGSILCRSGIKVPALLLLGEPLLKQESKPTQYIGLDISSNKDNAGLAMVSHYTGRETIAGPTAPFNPTFDRMNANAGPRSYTGSTAPRHIGDYGVAKKPDPSHWSNKTTKKPTVDKTEEIKESKGGLSAMFKEMFKGFEFGQAKGDMFALGMNGIAVKGEDGTYRTYDPATGGFITSNEFKMDIPGGIFLLPATTITVGDIILKNDRTALYITSVEGNEIKAVNFKTATGETVIPERNLFGFQIFMKVFTLLNMGGAGAANPMGNFAQMMPMMAMMECFGEDKGGKSGMGDMMQMMFMTQMMGGAMGGMFGAPAVQAAPVTPFNLFGNMFGAPAQAAPVATPVVPTVPVAPTADTKDQK